MSRQQCDCQAQSHPLINNCISCGRIVCAIEKEGPCLFCGNPVKRKGEQFTEQEFPDMDSEVAYKTAVFHKEKLLDFNKREIHQTNIIDDQIDYYQIADNIWESTIVREQAVQRILQQQVEIQKAENENIMELDPVTMQFTIAKQREIDHDAFRESANIFLQEANYRQVNVDNRLNSMDKCKEIYSDLQKELSSNQTKKMPKFQTSCSQVQNDDYFLEFQKEISSLCPVSVQQDGYDQEFYQLNDCGMCLSMHQPWAQLVVEGLKRIEGRMWATTYKGPLWIHAGAKKPTTEEISQVEKQYKILYPNQPMPVRYPTGALIGCVDFIGIQRRQTYEKQIPSKLREEGDTEYKFVFRNPRKLIYPIQMRGANNLFKIEDQVRSIAVNNLERIPTSWAQYLVDESQCDEIKVQQEMPIEQEVIEPEKSATDELKQNIQVNVNVPKKQVQKQEAFVGMNYGWCQLIDGYVDQAQLLNMAKYLESKIGKPGKQQKNEKNTHKVQIKYSLIPHNESILQKINKIVGEQLNYSEVVVYYMRGDDRGFTINSTQGIAVLGAPISVTYEQQRIIIDQQRFISIYGGDNFKINLTKEPSQGDVLKEIGQEYSYKSWVIIFNK